MDNARIGIIGGAGWLGRAMARALLGATGPEALICSYRSAPGPDAPDCRWTSDNAALIAQSDVVILSLRPEDWRGLQLDLRGRLVISVMARVSVAAIAQASGASRIARALPNAAADLGQSYTPFFLASNNQDDEALLHRILRCFGQVDRVDDEDHINYFTAMTGSGQAFPALLIQAMIADAVARGIPPDIATRAGRQLLIGAGALSASDNTPPAAVVDAFLDYDGTTAAGLRAMQTCGFTEAVQAGLAAAYEKAKG